MAEYRLTVHFAKSESINYFMDFDEESKVIDLLNAIQDAADKGTTIKMSDKGYNGPYTKYLRPSNALSWSVFKHVPGEDEKGPDTNPFGDTGKWVGVLAEDSPLVQ